MHWHVPDVLSTLIPLVCCMLSTVFYRSGRGLTHPWLGGIDLRCVGGRVLKILSRQMSLSCVRVRFWPSSWLEITV